ncbi:MAG: lytic murein transglycosylase [Desulfobulbaceae bacterium]|nr:lytic murein transglycosylase [Desulfobulbaceae bacterium]
MISPWRRITSVFCLCLLLMTFAFVADAADKPLAADLVEDGQLINLQSPRYQKLFADLRKEHGFTQVELEHVFSGVSVNKRVLELMDQQWESKPYYQYYPRFITISSISRGRKMLREHKELLDRVEKEIGVEREIVVAIWGIETRYGKNTGSFDMFTTLNTMFDAYPRRRSFYRKQLVHFLLLCRDNDVDPLTVKGSYGGAFGQTQFIPSSFREYAVDFDKDGRRDVWNSTPDVLASIANYLRRYGWVYGTPVYKDLGNKLKDEKLVDAFKKGRKGLIALDIVTKAQGLNLPQPPNNKSVTVVGLERKNNTMRYVAGYPNFQAITAWNHSNRYAMAVAELAMRLK